MRFDDFIKKPAKPQKPLTYTESLQAKLDAEMSSKFTTEEAAIKERKRKRKKIKYAAYGPGSYGWYGYDAGYSGDGGVEESYGKTFGQASQEKINIMHKHNIKPGDAEWFKLWFGLPYMTGEKPHEDK